MRNKLIAGLVLALVLPSLALAAKPPTPGHSHASHGKAAPKVMYVLKGAISSYTAAAGASNGSITILVKRANHHGAALKEQTLTIAVSSATRVVFDNDGSTIADGDNGVVKVRAAKSIAAADLAAAFQAAPTVAFQVIDQGPAS